MNKKHGMTGHHAWTAWLNMKSKCSNPNNPNWSRYGGRGIDYCEKWDRFEGFWEDMGSGWKKGLCINRVDDDGEYNKSNCKWSPRHELMAYNKEGSWGDPVELEITELSFLNDLKLA